MRTAPLALLLVACTTTTTTTTTPGTSEGDAGERVTDANSDVASADAGEELEPEPEGDAGDAAPPAPGFNSPCDPAADPSGCPYTIDAPGATSQLAQCISRHTLAGDTGRDLYGRCSFDCYLVIKDGIAIDPIKQNLCAAVGGTCKPLFAGGGPHCVPNY